MANDDPTPLASLKVTHIYYDPDDKLSLLCAYLALLPQALCVVYATLILFTREAEIALTFAGQLACEVMNFTLKRIIKEERPPRLHGQGYGMPSSHAQFVSFWSIHLTLFLLLRHSPQKMKGSGALVRWTDLDRPWSVLERAGLSLVAAGIAAATAWSRVYLSYHTPRQVLAGCGAGAVSAVGWFIIVAVFRQTGWLSWILDTAPARALRIRDLVVEEDISQAGWEKWKTKKVSFEKVTRSATKSKVK